MAYTMDAVFSFVSIQGRQKSSFDSLSKMDKSVRGYKQLVQAKDRMINNVRANGYEIISLLGQEYNDGMQFQTRFVPDESLPEGKRIITGMIKMQVNYNGKMIQPAEIVVSQNI